MSRSVWDCLQVFGSLSMIGKSNPSGGWTTLHLASYFGQKDVVEELLKYEVEVNVQTDLGDTPLHLAALSGRKEVVLLLLRYGACATVINGAAQTPRAVTEDDEIITMLEASERRESRKMEEKLLGAAREGDSATVAQLFCNLRPPDIHCKDPDGNTPLHMAACRGHRRCVDELLRNGASPAAKNKRGQSALDLTEDDGIKNLLDKSQEKKETASAARRYEGVLWKKSKYLAWTSVWVVLEDGNLSWYSKQSDAEYSDLRLGCKPLIGAQCVVKGWDKYFFTLKCSDASIHHFKVSFSCGEPEIIRKKWLEAIEEHSACRTRWDNPEITRAEEEEAAEEEPALGDVSDCLQAAESFQQNLESQVASFVSMVKPEDNNNMAGPEQLKAREICELCSETSSALRRCLDLLSRREEVWSVKLEQEVEKNKILSDALQTLATERQRLKQALSSGRKSPTTSTLTEDEFFDAVSGE